MKINTYDSQKKKQVLAGIYNDNNKVFVKSVKPFHYMRIAQGYGIQIDVIHKLNQLGCEKVVILTTDGKEYESHLSDWTGNNARVMDFGSGSQIFLSTKYMDDKSQLQLAFGE